MKQIYTLTTLLLLIISTNLKAQTSDIISGLNKPSFMVLNGNDLYFSTSDGYKISKIDITDATPTAIDVVTGATGARGLVLKGNDLYIAESSANKISKIDITDATPTLTDVVTGLNNPIGLVLNGNDLYISDFRDDKVSKINITDAIPTVVDVITGVDGAQGMFLNGNDLYIAESIADKISKIDITDATPTTTDVVTTGLDFPRNVLLYGNDLYIADYSADKISKIDITDATPTLTNIVTEIDRPIGLVIYENQLYTSLYGENKIIKIDAALAINTTNNYLNFDGANDYVSTALPSVFSDITNNDITIEASIYPESTDFSRILFAQLDSNNFISVSYSANDLFCYVNNTAAQKTDADSIALNEWTHFSITWDASTQEILIYINGVLQSTVYAGTSSTGTDTDNVMTLGSRTDQNQFFDGSIDELRIWNTVRTQSEISTNMDSELTLPQTNLVNYYKFNHGQAGENNTGITTLNDELNTNHGTLNSFALNGNLSNWLTKNTLSTQGFDNINLQVKLFPNPTTNYIQIYDLNKPEHYRIYNVIGTEISKGIISNNEKIDVNSYSNGLYFLKFENGNSIKFLKK